LLLSTSMPTDPTRDGRQRRYVLSPDLLGVGSAGGAWTRMGVQIGQYHGSACYATSPPVLRCWSLGWPRPGRYVVPSKSSPRPGPRRTENVDGEGVRRDPCGQNPRRRCAIRVRPVPGLPGSPRVVRPTSKRRSAAARPPWQQRWVLDDLAGCDTDVHERANFDVHERANFDVHERANF